MDIRGDFSSSGTWPVVSGIAKIIGNKQSIETERHAVGSSFINTCIDL